MKFSPCIDKCTQEGLRCEGCGRTHQEIAETKKMVMALVNYAKMKNYENSEEFAHAVGKKILQILTSS